MATIKELLNDDQGAAVQKMLRRRKGGEEPGEEKPRNRDRRRPKAPTMDINTITTGKPSAEREDNVITTPGNGPSPFGRALVSARAISSRWPDREQPLEMRDLQDCLSLLSKDQRTGLIFRLVNETIEGRTKIQALFAAARAIRMTAVAFNVAAIVRIMNECNVDLAGLKNVGLATIKFNTDSAAYVVYHVGWQALSEAEKRLLAAGNAPAANILREHRLQAEKRRLLASAEADARASLEKGD